MGEFIAEFFGQIVVEILCKGFLKLIKNIGLLFLQLFTFNKKSFDETRKDYQENALPYWLGLIILVIVIFLIFYIIKL